MAKRRNDYRLTRRGKSIDPSKSTKKVVFTIDRLCSNCQQECQQEKIENYAPNGKMAYQWRCSGCGITRFAEYADRSNYNKPDSRKGRLVQSFQEYLWGWLDEHIEKVLFLELPHKINLFRGKIGFPRRHKGKPVFSSNELHPDFLRYLDTPEYIKRLSKAVKSLEDNDPETFDFIVLRAMGYSFTQIDDANHFPRPLTKPMRSSIIGHGSYERTPYCIKLNKRATTFLIESIPDDLLNTFGTKDMIDAVKSTIGKGDNTRPRDVVRWERVTCPKCNGKDLACLLCKDGTVPRWLCNKYQEKIANGEAWE